MVTWVEICLVHFSVNSIKGLVLFRCSLLPLLPTCATLASFIAQPQLEIALSSAAGDSASSHVSSFAYVRWPVVALTCSTQLTIMFFFWPVTALVRAWYPLSDVHFYGSQSLLVIFVACQPSFHVYSQIFSFGDSIVQH